MNIQRIEKLIQFAILCAGRQEDWRQRELGPIHLIKYVYLADYHYALAHGGETYTGLPWRFYKFGPWQEQCFEAIRPALEAIGAEMREYSHPKYEDDFVKWKCSDDEHYEKLYNMLPLEIAGRVEQYVRKFGADTEGLLDYVYKTPPMLKAAPNEVLVFEPEPPAPPEAPMPEPVVLTRRQEKKRKELLEKVRAEVRMRMERKKKEREQKRYLPPPRYDEIYFEGLAQLDRLAGEPITPCECVMEVSPDVWKSKARFDPDLS